jgi:hypothetical protein
MYKAIYAELPTTEQVDHRRGDFWELVRRREDALAIGKTGEADAVGDAVAVHATTRPVLGTA